MRAISEFEGIYLHRDPIDMRKAINGLCEIVSAEGMGDLMGPHLFVFAGKRARTIKVLYFDNSGFALWTKRLEKAHFVWPQQSYQQGSIPLTVEQMQWLLEGYDIWKMKPFEKLHFDRFC